MYNRFKISILLLCIITMTCACTKENEELLLNKSPMTFQSINQDTAINLSDYLHEESYTFDINNDQIILIRLDIVDHEKIKRIEILKAFSDVGNIDGTFGLRREKLTNSKVLQWTLRLGEETKSIVFEDFIEGHRGSHGTYVDSSYNMDRVSDLSDLRLFYEKGYTHQQGEQRDENAYEYQVKAYIGCLEDNVAKKLLDEQYEKGEEHKNEKELIDKDENNESYNISTSEYLEDLEQGQLYMSENQTLFLKDTDNKYTHIAYNIEPLPELSMDKSHIVFIDDIDFETINNLWLYNFKSQEMQKLTNYDYGQDPSLTVKDVEWINNYELLVIVGFPYGTIVQGGDLYHYDLRTKEFNPLLKHKVGMEYVSSHADKGAITVKKVIWDDDNYLKFHYENEKISLNKEEVKGD